MYLNDSNKKLKDVMNQHAVPSMHTYYTTKTTSVKPVHIHKHRNVQQCKYMPGTFLFFLNLPKEGLEEASTFNILQIEKKKISQSTLSVVRLTIASCQTFTQLFSCLIALPIYYFTSVEGSNSTNTPGKLHLQQTTVILFLFILVTNPTRY